jgi:hypothetical protein
VHRTVERGQRQGVFRDVDVAEFSTRLLALTDGLAIQVLTGSAHTPVTRMRDVLTDFCRDEIFVARG